MKRDLILGGGNEDFLVGIVEISVDIAQIVRDCKNIVAAFKIAVPDNDFANPYSILLSHNPSEQVDSDIISYKDVHNKRFFDRAEQAFLKPEYQSTSLSGLVKILPFPFSIMRLSILPPNTIIGMHTDDACHAQLAITTNPDCFVAARSGETKHVPIDGKLYIISTTLPHTAFNASAEERIHLSISIFDDDYLRILRDASLA